MRSWLSDVLSRRVRRPALEQTIFHQLDELERGPLEHLASLVHMVIDELRLAQRRLNDQARDLRSLERTVSELGSRVEGLAAATPAPEAPVDDGHVLLLSSAEGYRLVDGDGPPPEPGGLVEVGGRRYRVLNRRASPYPGDRRRCALALPAPEPPAG